MDLGKWGICPHFFAVQDLRSPKMATKTGLGLSWGLSWCRLLRAGSFGLDPSPILLVLYLWALPRLQSCLSNTGGSLAPN